MVGSFMARPCCMVQARLVNREHHDCFDSRRFACAQPHRDIPGRLASVTAMSCVYDPISMATAAGADAQGARTGTRPPVQSCHVTWRRGGPLPRSRGVHR